MSRIGGRVRFSPSILIALGGLLWVSPAASRPASYGERIPAYELAYAGDDYAVIVHPSTPTTNLSLKQVRSIFRGDQQFWPGGARVVVLVHAPGSVGREIALRHLYQMNEGEFKRYWIGKVFRDDLASGPKIVSSSALAKKLTASIPGAISIIPAFEVDETVRALSIDRRLPGQEGYVLAGEAQPAQAGR